MKNLIHLTNAAVVSLILTSCTLIDLPSEIEDTESPQMKPITAVTEYSGVVTITLDTVYHQEMNYWEVYENDKLSAQLMNYHWIDNTPSESYLIKRYDSDKVLIDSHTVQVESEFPIEGITYPTEHSRLFTRGAWNVNWNPQSFSDEMVNIKLIRPNGESFLVTTLNDGEYRIYNGNYVTVTVTSQYTTEESYTVDNLQYDFINSDNTDFIGEIQRSYSAGDSVYLKWKSDRYYAGTLNLVQSQYSENGRTVHTVQTYQQDPNYGSLSGIVPPFNFPDVEPGIYYWYIRDGETDAGAMSTPFIVE